MESRRGVSGSCDVTNSLWFTNIQHIHGRTCVPKLDLQKRKYKQNQKRIVTGVQNSDMNHQIYILNWGNDYFCNIVFRHVHKEKCSYFLESFRRIDFSNMNSEVLTNRENPEAGANCSKLSEYTLLHLNTRLLLEPGSSM